MDQQVPTAASVANDGDPPSPSEVAQRSVTATSELVAPVIVDVRASDGLERIHAAAIAASAPACHGTTQCTGGTAIPPGTSLTVECGAVQCGTTGCGKIGIGPLRAHQEQPQEAYFAFVMPNGDTCLAYNPSSPRSLTACCVIPDL